MIGFEEHGLTAKHLRLTVVGRHTGGPHTVTLWFAHHAGSIYFLAHAREHRRGTHWYQNLRAAGRADLEMGPMRVVGAWRPLDSDIGLEFVTRLFEDKYGRLAVDQWYRATERLPVRLELEPPA